MGSSATADVLVSKVGLGELHVSTAIDIAEATRQRLAKFPSLLSQLFIGVVVVFVVVGVVVGVAGFLNSVEFENLLTQESGQDGVISTQDRVFADLCFFETPKCPS